MHRVIALAAGSVLALLAAPSSAQDVVAHGAQFGWDQEAASAAQAQSYVYTLYVNGGGSPLGDVSCSRSPVFRTFECVAPLPDLAPGTYALELAAGVVIDGTLVESTLSATLHVIVPGGGPGGAIVNHLASAVRLPADVATLDRVSLAVARVAAGLTHPTDLSFAPGGVMFVTERGGTVRLLSNDTLQTVPALALADVAASPAGALLSIALDPRFETNGFGYFVYAASPFVYAASSPDSRLTYHVARFRFAGGSFAERVVLLDDIAADSGHLAAAIRFGPDGMLYVALGDTADPRRDDLGSFNGKVLRLTADGTTPRDQPAASPIYVSGLSAPRSLAWDDDGALWILDVVDGASTELRVVDATQRAAAAAPFEPGATSMVRYDHPAMPSLRGDVLIAANGQVVIGSPGDSPDSAGLGAALDHDDFEGVQVIAVGPLGEIYALTTGALLRASQPRH